MKVWEWVKCRWDRLQVVDIFGKWGWNRSWQLTAMIWPKKFVRLKSHFVTRFSRRVWDPQKFVLKLRRVKVTPCAIKITHSEKYTQPTETVAPATVCAPCPLGKPV